MSKENSLEEPISEFELIAQKISQAKKPEDIFGALADEKSGLSLYYQLCKKVHPNAFVGNENADLANSAFIKLHDLWGIAQAKLKAGIYGVSAGSNQFEEKIVIKTKRREYEIFAQGACGEITNSYLCRYKDSSLDSTGLLKIAQDPLDNDLVENEARILRYLEHCSGYEKFNRYFPRLIESFVYFDPADHIPRQANAFKVEDELYSLEEVREQSPSGIDPKDMAWIWRRLLVGLGFTHNNEVINSAVLPPFIFIQPTKHGLVLSEWSYATAESKISGERISAINSEYENWYPAEVFAKELPTPGLDILMGARSMIYLLGGDPITGALPDSIDKRVGSFFKGCLLPKPLQRPQDAWSLMYEFDQLIEMLWGPRTFRPFSMPKRDSRISFR